MPIEYIYQSCQVCNGDGEQTPEPGVPNECPHCGGTGKILWGWLQDELEGAE